MSQKSNRIIFLIIIIALICVFYLLAKKELANRSSNSYRNIAFNLFRHCDIAENNYIQVCYYSTIRKVLPVMERGEVIINDESTSLPVVHPNDMVVFKVNLATLFRNNPKIYDKINNKNPLCFRTKPILKNTLVLSDRRLSTKKTGSVTCFKNAKDGNLHTIGIIGIIPSIQAKDKFSKTKNLLIEAVQPNEERTFDESSIYSNDLKPVFTIFPAIIKN